MLVGYPPPPHFFTLKLGIYYIKSYDSSSNFCFYNNTRIFGNEPGGVAGSVTREVWEGIGGTSTDDIPLGTTPTVTGTMSDLNAR